METITPTTIIIFSKNTPGILFRISNLLLRRKINIESLTVSEIKNEGVSRFTIVINEPETTAQKIAKQFRKIIDVLGVTIATDEALITTEIALFKVGFTSAEEAKEIKNIAFQFDAHVVQENGNKLTLEKAGSEKDIFSLYQSLSTHDVKEFVRSGRIAVAKEDQTPTVQNSMKDHAQSINAIDVSAIKKVELLARSKKGVVSLAQGIPSFFTPDYIKNAAKEAMDQNLTDKYTPGYGIEALRIAIATKVKRDNDIVVNPSQVIVTHGGLEALMAVFLSLLDVRDEIIVLTPDYASHITQISIATHGRMPISVPLKESEKGWTIDSALLEASITPHTKAILICNPSNPTGKVYTKKELTYLAELAVKHNLYIISDEMYEYFTYDRRTHISIGSFKEVQDRVISVFGVSKSYSMTGWRIGYITASQPLIDTIFKVHDSLVTCPTAVSQYAALAAIEGDNSIVTTYRKAYEKRRAMVIEKLSQTDRLFFTPPEGAYYSFPKILAKIDDQKLVMDLINKAKVAVVPGSAFGKGGEGHIRISFGTDEKNLEEGLDRFVNYINKKI